MSVDASKVPPERLLRMQAACARRDDPSSGRTDGRTGGRRGPTVARRRRAASGPDAATIPLRGGRGGAVSVCSWRAASAQTSDRVTAPGGGGDRAVSTGIAAAQRCSAQCCSAGGMCTGRSERPRSSRRGGVTTGSSESERHTTAVECQAEPSRAESVEAGVGLS